MTTSRSNRTHSLAELDLMGEAIAICVRVRLSVEVRRTEVDPVIRRRSLAHSLRLAEFVIDRMTKTKERIHAITKEDPDL